MSEPGAGLAGPRWLPPALRVRSYRWYWSAQWPVLLGTWMQTVALGYFVYTQTQSVNAVAFVAAASGLPAVALSVVGGALADRYPRRRILLVTQSTLAWGRHPGDPGLDRPFQPRRPSWWSRSSSGAARPSTCPPARPWSPTWSAGSWC